MRIKAFVSVAAILACVGLGRSGRRRTQTDSGHTHCRRRRRLDHIHDRAIAGQTAHAGGSPSKSEASARREALDKGPRESAGYPKFTAKVAAPASFCIGLPSQLSYWGNDIYGDCVSAEEAFAKATWSLYATGTELFIPSATLTSWASKHGFLNGADLTEVMETMAASGITVGNTTYTDGTPSTVDWTSLANLQAAIAQGPVKLGVDGDPLENIVGTTNGWFAKDWRGATKTTALTCSGTEPSSSVSRL